MWSQQIPLYALTLDRRLDALIKIKIKNPKPFIHIKFPGNTEFTGNTAFWRHCLKKYWFTIKILLYYWKDEDTNLILRKHTY